MALPTVLPEPLVTGQRMSVDEFIRRWENLPDIKNAELIEGVVDVESPLGASHALFDTRIIHWLATHVEGTPGTDARNNCTMYLVPGSVPQPDVYLRLLPECGGASTIKEGFVHGVPELIAEICDSSKARDLGPKRALYERAGVREYLTVEIDPFRVTWRSLTASGQYENIPPASDGSLRSRLFPGLWLDPAALEQGRPIEPVLRKGMRTRAYRSFRDSLAVRLNP